MGKDSLDKKEPTSYSFFFPFYNLKSSHYGNMKSQAYLWIPILGSVFGHGYDKRTSEVNYNFLFFYFSMDIRTVKIIGNIFFFHSTAIHDLPAKSLPLFLLFLNMRTDTYGVKSNSYYLIPFFIIWKSAS